MGNVTCACHLVEKAFDEEMVPSVGTACVLGSCRNLIGFELIKCLSIVLLLPDWILHLTTELNRFVSVRLLFLILEWCNCVVFEECAHIGLIVL